MRQSTTIWLKVVLIALGLTGCCGPDDAACTMAQNNALAGMLASSSYHPYQAPAPVFTSCTTGSTGIVNCLSY